MTRAAHSEPRASECARHEAGGDAELGQVWRLVPDGDGGTLTLVYESTDGGLLDQPDNLVVTPHGWVLIAEDGDGEDIAGGTNLLRGLTPDGRIFDFAENVEPNSRLSCQIKVSDELDGLVVRLPESQH